MAATNWALELNGDEDEDAALRRAIAMSLGEAGVDQQNGGPSQLKEPEPEPEPEPAPTKSTPASTSMSAFGLDRKKMEEERLARLGKRKAESMSNDGTTSTYYGFESPARRPRLADEHPKNPSAAAPPPISSNSLGNQAVPAIPKPSSAARLPYAKGTVLRTYARGSPRDRDITIEDVLQKDELELAVLSSFQWDEDWLMTKLNLKKTKVLMIAYAADDAQKKAMRDNVPSDVIRFVFPPMDNGASIMHSKLQLLKYSKYLRIAVPTGNLVPYDWGETGTMENMVFLIDLPRIDDAAKRSINVLTPFGEDLSYFLTAQGVDDKMIQSLRNYDFGETTRYGFVHTIAGSHPNPDVWQRTGYCGLGRAIKALGLATDEDVDLDYVCSSIGALNKDILTALYNACKGDSGLREYEARISKPRNNKSTSAPSSAFPQSARTRVYFPSRDTVRRSRGGSNAAGTICFQRRWWKAETFPQEILRDCVNVRPGVLMHTKLMFVRRAPSQSQSFEAPGWFYLGSHNLSESAWGRLVRDRTTKSPKLSARNWECGVVFTIPTAASSPQNRQPLPPRTEGSHMLDAFQGSVPVPMVLPGAPFQDHGRQPFFRDEP